MKRQPYRHHTGGFSLVELLVVIAILAVLISILVPTSAHQFESAKRSVCKAHLEQLGIGHNLFAAEHNGSLPPHQAKLDNLGQGVYAVYSRHWKKTAEYDRYRGNGILYYLGYIKSEFLYCPSWTHPYTQHRQVNPTNYRGGSIWLLPEFPSHQAWMQTSYAFRGARDLLEHNDPRSPHMFRDPPTATPIVSDHFSDPRRGSNFHHQDGYNTLYLDGSVDWVSDPDEEIRLYNGGRTYHAGRANYKKQERVWFQYFTR